MSDPLHQAVIDLKTQVSKVGGDVAEVKGIVMRHDGQIAEMVPLLKLALTRRTRPERVSLYFATASLVIIAGVALVACMHFVR